MPYKAEGTNVVNEETREVVKECDNEEDARRMAHTLNEMEKDGDE
jgi:Ca2+-binding EF-hand superfamily protein